MIDRDIKRAEIMAVLKKEVDVVVYPSDRDPEIDLYFGKVDNKYILVVLNARTKNVITVRKMRAKEKTIYEEDIKNEK